MNKISTYRKQLGLSQRQLATHLGWIQSRLANYEANFRTPGLEECRKIVATLNRINIFQRWRKRETAEHCEKFSALIPAILEAIRESAPELHKRITAGQSIEYLLSQLLKKPQWQARYFLARRWRILSGSVTKPYMRYRRYVAVIASSTRDMTSE